MAYLFALILALACTPLKGLTEGKRVVAEEDNANSQMNKIKRTTASSRQLGQQDSIDIEGTRGCRLRRQATRECFSIYKASNNWQQCYLAEVLQQLTPGVDLNVMTNGFINQAKFSLRSISRDDCKKNQITIDIVSRESQDTACGYFKVRGGGRYSVSWKLKPKDFTDFMLDGRGRSSFSDEDDRLVSFNKVYGQETVNLTVTSQANADMSVERFAKKFDIDMSDLFPRKLDNVISRINPASLMLSQAQIGGVIFPGTSFEIFAIGKLTAPFAFQKARQVLLLAQYFKEDEKEGGKRNKISSISPAFTLFASFRRINANDFRSVVEVLTGMQLPECNLLANMKKFAFTVANKDITLAYNDEVKDLVEQYQTKDDQKVAYPGVNFRFIKAKMKAEVRKIDPSVDVRGVPKKVSLQCEVGKTSIRFTVAEILNLSLRQLAILAFKDDNSMFSNVLHIISKPNQVNFDSITFTQDGPVSSFTVSGNQTNELVLIPKVFSIRFSTISFTTEKTADGAFSEWRFNATGENAFLQEMANITIHTDENGEYICKGSSGIFSMDLLTNRTGASYLPRKFEEYFVHIGKLALTELYYMASFDPNNDVLRLVGKAILKDCYNNTVEIKYWINGEKPSLALGIVCQNTRLDRVVNTLFARTVMSQTWMTFDKIGIVMRGKAKPVPFYDQFLEKAEKKRGIQIITQGLQLDNVLSNDTFRKMAELLKFQYGPKMELQYIGQLNVKKEDQTWLTTFTVTANIEKGFCLNTDLPIRSLTSVIKSLKKGEFARLQGVCDIRRAGIQVQCVIFVDGSGEIRLRIDPKDELESNRLLPLSYLTLSPLKVLMSYPWKKCPTALDLISGMKIGTSRNMALSFMKKESEQHVDFEDPRKNTFIGSIGQTPLNIILKSFNINSMLQLLKGAVCRRLTVAYSAGAQEVWVDEFNSTVRKGLHFLCYLTVAEKEYFTRCSYKDSQEMVCKIALEKALNISDGFFLMSYSKDNSTFGPIINVKFGTNTVEATMDGYIKTVGIATKCSFTITDSKQDGIESMLYQAQVTGKIYKEIDGTMRLTGYGMTPETMKLSIDMDLTTKVGEQLPEILLNRLKDYKASVERRLKTIEDKVKEDEQAYQDHADLTKSLEDEIQSLVKDVRTIDQSIKDSAFELSRDCLDKARTVDMPGLVLDEKCASENGGKTSVCMKWQPKNTKALRVSDLVRCEAQKVKTYLKVQDNVKKVQILINNIVMRKGEMENEKEIEKIKNEVKQFSTKILEFLKVKTAVQGELDKILNTAREPGSFFTLESFRASTQLIDVHPPTIPYTARWTINGNNFASILEVIHMYPMWESLTNQVIRESFPSIDEAESAFEEADFRFGEVSKLRKKLNLSIAQTQAKKRSIVPSLHYRTILGREHSYLLDYAEPQIPQFTVRSDSTTNGFHSYSPWALLKSRDPFSTPNRVDIASGKSNITFPDGNDCRRVRSVVETYGVFADDINRMGRHYTEGKNSFDETKRSMWQDYQDCETQVHAMAKDSKGSDNDMQSMMYWLQPTREGLEYFRAETSRQFKLHDNQVFGMYKQELDKAYSQNNIKGINNYLSYLSNAGKTAYKRGMVSRADNDRGIKSLSQIAQTFSAIMSEKEIGIEQAMLRMNGIQKELEFIKTHVQNCV